jgi:YidC/Oxa1 family membrane protein insertase
MNKSSTIGYVLILLIFAGYLFLTQRNVKELNEKTRVTDSLERIQNVQDSIEYTAAAAIADTSVKADTTNLVASDTISETFFTIENDKVKVFLTNKGGRIASVQLKDYKRYDSSALVLFTSDKSEFNYTIPLESGVIQSNQLVFTANQAEVIVKEGKSTIALKTEVGGASIVQSYSLEPTSYLVDYQLTLNGFENKIAKKNRDFELNWNLMIQGQEKTLEDEELVTSLYYKYYNESGIESLSERSDDEERLQANIHWISYKQKFFNATLISPKGFSEDGFNIKVAEVTTPNGIDVRQMSSRLYFPYQFNTSENYNLQFYFGPNKYNSLKKLDIGLQKIIPLGWGIFGWVNKFIVIPIFDFLSSFISNYGIIILLLTILIKLVLFPFMYKIYVSTAKMRLLKPELDELKEKTGGDMQKMQQEQMKLYRKAGVNPFGGCLPQLIQLPILIAMFRFFPASIELRQQSFLWAEDLSTYDSILNIGYSIPFYGDHVSLFTLLMAVSTLIYSMNNTQMTGMGNQMKYITYLMPIMLLFWFNSYASGLSYYYFLANMITFGQNWAIKTFIVDEDKLHQQMKENKSKKGNNKKSSFQQRLEDMAKKRGLDPSIGRKK